MEILIYCLSLVFLIFCGMPIGFSLLLSSFFYVIFFSDFSLMIIPQKMMVGLDNFAFLAVPCYILLGEIMAKADITKLIVDLADALVGHIKGGLAQVNVVTSMIFAGVQGSAVADTCAVGSILIPAMIKNKYTPRFAAAITAASSAVGPIIPPSLPMVILGSVSGISVGRLFLGGAFPGFLLGIFQMTYCYFFAEQNREKDNDYDKEKIRKFSAVKLYRNLRTASLAITIPIVIIGGIVGGIFTPTEAGAISVFIGIILGSFFYRKLDGKGLLDCISKTLYLLGGVLLIVSSAAVFGWILSIEGATKIVGDALLTISKDPIVVMLVINGVFLILGCFIDTTALIIMLTPIFLPIAIRLGYDPVHFGVIMVLNLTIGLATPPLGLCMFIACGIAGISIESFMKSMFPLYTTMLLILLLTILFPQIVMFIPNMLMPVP